MDTPQKKTTKQRRPITKKPTSTPSAPGTTPGPVVRKVEFEGNLEFDTKDTIANAHGTVGFIGAGSVNSTDKVEKNEVISDHNTSSVVNNDETAVKTLNKEVDTVVAVINSVLISHSKIEGNAAAPVANIPGAPNAAVKNEKAESTVDSSGKIAHSIG